MISDVLAPIAQPLQSAHDLENVVEKLSRARIVMLGESSHGTNEFYEWRRLISQELIENHGFQFIAVEGDWPPCMELNRFARADDNKTDAREVLKNFRRWPTWMWANSEVARLTAFLKVHNSALAGKEKVGFYGLDVYSFFESAAEVLKQAEKIDPLLAQRIRRRYGCFDAFDEDEKAYARSLVTFPEGCESQAISVLKELLRLRLESAQEIDADLFDAQQNARIVRNAEQYYRAMIYGNEDSWNVRDRHMLETLDVLLNRFGPESKGIVWAHNTHIGDYRATDMLAEGQVNIGGLAREKWGMNQVALLGFGTYQGEVIASHAWDGPIEKLTVPPGVQGSLEAVFHEMAASLGQDRFFLWLENAPRGTLLDQTIGHRAIGVVYQPERERYGNYVPTVLSQRYDGFIFIDRTSALTPYPQSFKREELPETWPRGF